MLSPPESAGRLNPDMFLKESGLFSLMVRFPRNEGEAHCEHLALHCGEVGHPEQRRSDLRYITGLDCDANLQHNRLVPIL